ncbi:MAG: two-component system response regulator CreB [Polaromonas sp.]|nr:two-component system response regulator CreB [Polaromonas sp.]
MASAPQPRARVLLVEDDPAIAKAIIYTLERDGLAVTHSLLLGDARRQLERQPPDVLVLDVGLPDGSGLDLCRELRGAGSAQASLPVLMLSAHGEEIDRVLGLELGADDYVSKPFSPRELLARVRSLLRRARMPVPAPAATGQHAFEVDSAGQCVLYAGKPLPLTRREFGLLAELLRQPGRIRSRDELLSAVWGADSDSSDRTVDTHIKTLRAKLQDAAAGEDFIATHRGMGYAFKL